MGRCSSILKIQFGFKLGRSRMEAIHPRRLEYYGARKKKDLYMIVIDLEKAYNKVPKKVNWRAVTNKRIEVFLKNLH